MPETIDKTPKSIAATVGDVLKGFEKEELKTPRKNEYGRIGITKSATKAIKSRAKEKARKKANKKRRRSKKNK